MKRRWKYFLALNQIIATLVINLQGPSTDQSEHLEPCCGVPGHFRKEGERGRSRGRIAPNDIKDQWDKGVSSDYRRRRQQ
ncbi:hypothetical protein CEXT_747311 [Caerostris extrusa]|uniref:Secreted protein n=1 Tax=Caerostris extrusa TaxID=172846 RepID=A0AAV4S630_CAEEX|nr:hypothetical protein CEXT_747311 [Caerostris extrusa]